VIDGDSPANPEDWQASLFTNDDGVFCTATLIGARVVLTAAHCLDKGPTIGFTIKSVDYTARCTIAAKYKTDKTADYALCLTKTAISGIRFERLSFDPAELAKATTLTLAGFGCTRISSPIIKGFQIGDAKLLKRPGEIAAGPNLLQVLGGAALCPGDSGGGAFIVKKPSLLRKLVAINSELTQAGNDGTISTLASVSTPDFLCFGNGWLRDNAGNAAIPGFPTTVSCLP
jgi:Trypsin